MDAQGMPSLPLEVAAGSTPADASSQVETNHEISKSYEPSPTADDTSFPDLNSRPNKRRQGRPRKDNTSTLATNSLAQPQTTAWQSR